jgi:phage portal protein BeeE
MNATRKATILTAEEVVHANYSSFLGGGHGLNPLRVHVHDYRLEANDYASIETLLF